MSQQFEAALMYHAMRQEVKKQGQIIRSVRAGLQAHRDRECGTQMTETRIYVGLNDAETRKTAV